MNASTRTGRIVIYFLIFISGIAGLIYQVVWHKYLSLLLGAQARATAVVLAIFLGGISAGYAVFGRWSRWKPWNLLLAYSLVELSLGIWAFCFPLFFRAAFALTTTLYGWFGVQSLLVDVFVSTLLLGFPTFLMGGTLPLLTQGLSDSIDEASNTHAKIYGFNTVGACAGSLLAGYFLLPQTDMPSTVLAAGCINFLVAGISYFGFAKWVPSERTIVPRRLEEKSAFLSTHGKLIFAVAFLSGFYVIMLETIFIRLMGLTSGSANLNFTLIVSIFVFGLGFGSLFARKIGKYSEINLVRNQIGIAFSLFVLYWTVDDWAYWVHLVRITFRELPHNYYVYQVALGALFSALLLIPVGFCGLTLPICFHLIKDRQENLGDRVGQLYAFNTVGCVLGAVLGGYVLLNFFNLDHLLKLSVILALVSSCCAAAALLQNQKASPLFIGLGTAISTVVLLGILIAPTFDKSGFVQPFRQQTPNAASFKGAKKFREFIGASSDYLFYKDGPNTSVGVAANSTAKGVERSRTIFINGKSDGNTSGDLMTMSLTGHIPALFARDLEKVCVIGFGTGITTGAFLKYPDLQSVDVVEIANTAVEAAPYFDRYNGDVSKNPKVHFNVMDAFRFLGASKNKYDVIVSEPSNPWVAGVENLYSLEYYETVISRLKSNGLFVQWVQAYSFNDDLVKRVLKTVTSRFPYVTVFQMLEYDMAIVASQTPIQKSDIERAAQRYQSNSLAKESLKQTGLQGFESILGLEIMPAPITPILAEGAQPNELEAPRLSYLAAKAFFMGNSANPHSMRRTMKEFFPSVRHSLLSTYVDGRPLNDQLVDQLRDSYCLSSPSRSPRLCEEVSFYSKSENIGAGEFLGRNIAQLREDLAAFQIERSPASIKKGMLDDKALSRIQKSFDVYKRYYSPVAPLPLTNIMSLVETCIRDSAKDSEIHGDCLLQKAAILEVADPNPVQFKQTVDQFVSWFSELPAKSESYNRFKKANEILQKVLNEIQAAQSIRS